MSFTTQHQHCRSIQNEPTRQCRNNAFFYTKETANGTPSLFISTHQTPPNIPILSQPTQPLSTPLTTPILSQPHKPHPTISPPPHLLPTMSLTLTITLLILTLTTLIATTLLLKNLHHNAHHQPAEPHSFLSPYPATPHSNPHCIPSIPCIPSTIPCTQPSQTHTVRIIESAILEAHFRRWGEEQGWSVCRMGMERAAFREELKLWEKGVSSRLE